MSRKIMDEQQRQLTEQEVLLAAAKSAWYVVPSVPGMYRDVGMAALTGRDIVRQAKQRWCSFEGDVSVVLKSFKRKFLPTSNEEQEKEELYVTLNIGVSKVVLMDGSVETEVAIEVLVLMSQVNGNAVARLISVDGSEIPKILSSENVDMLQT